MPRKPDVWQRDGSGPWYAWINGKRERVADASLSKPQARAAYYAMRSAPVAKVRAEVLTVQDMLNLWSIHVSEQGKRDERSAGSVVYCIRFAQFFVSRFGALAVAALQPHDVAQAVASVETWGQATRLHAARTLKSAFRWGVQWKYIAASPIDDLPGGETPRRETIVTPDEATILLDAASTCFADLLRGLWLTGCRPGEIYGLTIDRVDFASGTWQVVDKNRRKTRKRHRTIYLSPDAVALTARLIGDRTEGLVFRNRAGRRWQATSVHNRMKLLCRKQGLRTVAVKEFRHLWATDAIASGTPIAIVAECLGHRDWKMLEQHYSHLSTRSGDLRAAVAKIRPS